MNYNKAVFEAAYGTSKQLPKDENIEFAFSGHSNVGKSSLMNAIFGRKALARVSSQPGKTVTVNFYDVEGVKFVDLPGYGYAKVSQAEKEKWGRYTFLGYDPKLEITCINGQLKADLVEGYLMSDRDIRLVVQLVDSRHVPTKDDIQMINFMIDNEMPFVIALTKCDKLNKSERKKRENAFMEEIPCADQITMIWTSTETGEGIADLKEIFEELAADDEEDYDDAE